jgi:cysteine-rich repeat protein
MCLPADNGFVCFQVGDLEDLPDDGNVCTADTCKETGMTFTPVKDGNTCDNGKGTSGDYCAKGLCSDQVCGDGIKGRDEACDDGNKNDCDGCLATCKLHDNFCGDDILCLGEDCDDGNQNDGDGCSSTCAIEPPPTCPDGMVKVTANEAKGIAADFCMDLYEASRPDATATAEGVDNSRAVSQAGVLPWYVNPANAAVLATFQSACGASGKHLCSAAEWGLGCTGDAGNIYTWGNTWDGDICNAETAFCAQYCADNAILPANCNTNQGCGYSYNVFKVVPTGSFPDCQDQYGAFDVNGNVWELVPVPAAVDARGYVIKGGAFNCGTPSLRFRCDFNATWNELYAGFRCCADL